MGQKWNKDELKKGLILTISLCVVVLFSAMLGRIGTIFSIINKIFRAGAPLIVGFVIAFLLNPIMTFFEKVIFKGLKKMLPKIEEKTVKKIATSVSVALSVAIFVALIAGLLVILIPQLTESIEKLIGSFPTYIQEIELWAKKQLSNNEELKLIVGNYLNNFENSAMTFLQENILPNMNTIVSKVSSGIVGGVRFVFNFIIGIIIAVYILADKEELAAQGKKVIYSVCSKEKGNEVLNGIDYIYSVFGGFINGKIIDSIIIGLICALFCQLVEMPYAVLISVVIGVTNVIPFFGPFIGAIPTAFLVLVEDPKMCIIYIIFVLILQQVDGNILGPLILGDSTGLSGLWVMFAILIGGNLFGFAGMLLGVPVFACVYTFLTILLRDKLKKQGMTNETEYFMGLRGFDSDGNPVYGPKKKRESAKGRKKRLKQQERLQKAKETIADTVHAVTHSEHAHSEKEEAHKEEAKEEAKEESKDGSKKESKKEK